MTADPTFDPVAAFPDVVAARQALLGQDWPAVEAYFATVRDSDDLSFALANVLTGGRDEPYLRDVVRSQGSILAKLLLARSLIACAWEARTAARAQHVSREQFTAFHDHLRQAEPILIEVTALEPENAPAWGMRLITARGLELGQAEAQRRYDECARRSPHNSSAQLQLVQQLCPKWSGSFEAMHAFARRCLDESPPGSSSPVVVVSGHLEHGLDLDDTEAYLRRPDVRSELAEAAQRSVLHPAYRPGYQWVRDHNHFALAYALAGDHVAAAVHFRELGPYGHEITWGCFGDPKRQFCKHRDRALAKG